MAKTKIEDELQDIPELDPADAYAGAELDDEIDGEVTGDRGDDFGTEPAADSEPAGEKEPETEAPEPETAAEGEEEPETEAAGEEEPEAEQETAPADPRIPKKRFDEVNEQRKAYKRELEELKAQQQAATEASEGEYDFDEAEDEYARMVLDGRIDDAKAKRNEIRSAERAAIQHELSQTSQATYSEQRANEEIAALAEDYVARYPALDADNEETFNEDLLDEAVVFMRSYMEMGHTKVSAFQKAITSVAKSHDLVDVTAAPAEAPAPAKPAKQQAAKPTRTADKNQPPAPTAAHGGSSQEAGASKIDFDNITDEEMEALPLARLRELRGDLL